MDKFEKFYSVAAFAERIGVSVHTLRYWDRNGQLPAHHRTQGGHRMYSESQAVQYLGEGIAPGQSAEEQDTHPVLSTS